ncbi:MAG: FAD-dependent oxidoreductase [Verrucomicrobiia bacterium]
MDALIVGGGFFGAYLALLLKERGLSPVVCEREDDLLRRASYHNQARVHHGYHYPRSLMTAVRSRINFPRFLEDFPDCICTDFEKYYAIGSVLGKVTAAQFETFMGRVGAPLEPAAVGVARLFDSRLIERVWKAREAAFDAGKLRLVMRSRLQQAGVEVRLGAEVVRVEPKGDGTWEAWAWWGHEEIRIRSRWIFNCTYSGLNRLRRASGMELLPLKHELTEMTLVEPPSCLRGLAVTVMCGPFFSLMPFPDQGLWTLSHVRYTPHHSWRDGPDQPWCDPYEHFSRSVKATNGPLMIRDAARYLPAMAGCRQVGSLWEVKTVLPQSELDDGRPILFHRDQVHSGFISVMGGKLDNIYDLPIEIDALGI